MVIQTQKIYLQKKATMEMLTLLDQDLVMMKEKELGKHCATFIIKNINLILKL
jgi:hypothetical protein